MARFMNTAFLSVSAISFMITGAGLAALAAWVFLPTAIGIAAITGLATGAALFGWIVVVVSSELEATTGFLALIEDKTREKYSSEIDAEILERETKIRAEAALAGMPEEKI